MGAESFCGQAAATTVVCDHDATAGGPMVATSTCRSEGLDLGSVIVVGTCRATLDGLTSGAGKETVDGFAPGCQTVGFFSGTVSFSDTTGYDYPDVVVSIVNNAGNATFAGQAVNAAGVTVAHTEGTFTLACGSTAGLKGAFTGTYTLVR